MYLKNRQYTCTLTISEVLTYQQDLTQKRHFFEHRSAFVAALTGDMFHIYLSFHICLGNVRVYFVSVPCDILWTVDSLSRIYSSCYFQYLISAESQRQRLHKVQSHSVFYSYSFSGFWFFIDSFEEYFFYRLSRFVSIYIYSFSALLYTLWSYWWVVWSFVFLLEHVYVNEEKYAQSYLKEYCILSVTCSKWTLKARETLPYWS